MIFHTDLKGISRYEKPTKNRKVKSPRPRSIWPPMWVALPVVPWWHTSGDLAMCGSGDPGDDAEGCADWTSNGFGICLVNPEFRSYMSYKLYDSYMPHFETSKKLLLRENDL